MSVVAYVLIVVACLIVSAFFSSSETALFRLRSHEIEEEIETGRGPDQLGLIEMGKGPLGSGFEEHVLDRRHRHGSGTGCAPEHLEYTG